VSSQRTVCLETSVFPPSPALVVLIPSKELGPLTLSLFCPPVYIDARRSLIKSGAATLVHDSFFDFEDYRQFKVVVTARTRTRPQETNDNRIDQLRLCSSRRLDSALGAIPISRNT